MTDTEVQGVAETIRYLRSLDKSLAAQSQRQIKAAAAPAAAAVKAALPPAPPLSGFDHAGRTGWRAPRNRSVTTSYRGRPPRGANTWALVRIVVNGAGANLYDMAGRGSPNMLARNLGGSPSRAAWPAVESFEGALTRNVKAACDKVMADTTRLLRKDVTR